MSQASATSAGPAPAPARRRNSLALFWGMIVRPRDTLAYLRDHGGLSWLWPALLVVVLTILSVIAVAPITQAIAEEQMQAVREQVGGDMSAEEAAQFEQALQFTNNPVFIIVFPAISGVIALAVGWALRGVLLFLASLMLGGHAKFAAMFRMGVWTTALPDAVRTIVVMAGTVVSGRLMQSGLAFLVPNPEGSLIPSGSAALWQTFLAGIDIYWIWGMVLTVLGVAATAEFSWRKGLAVTVIYWLITVGVSLAWVGLSLSMAAQFGGLSP
jgi:hypothetical protein